MAYVENAPHNPEVVGSNPAPATKNLQLVGYAGELFCLRAAWVLICQMPWALKLSDFIFTSQFKTVLFQRATWIEAFGRCIML